MTLIYIFWGEYAGFEDVLACAKARAGCPIVVISDGPAPKGVTHFSIHDFQEAEHIRKIMAQHVSEWDSKCIARWFVLREFLKNRPEAYPVFCSDWDILIFQDLEKAHAPFLKFDYAVSIDEGAISATYAISAPGPLDVFCEMIGAMFTMSDPRATGLNDMGAWKHVTDTRKFSVGNLNLIVNDSIFDHNMHCGEKEFVFTGPAKRVVFTDGFPYFQKLDGALVKANTFHCWGTYKTRTKEMREIAGIPL